MAKSHQKKQKLKQRKLRQRKNKAQRKNSRGAGIEVPPLSARIEREIDEIFDCLEDGDEIHSEKLLAQLVRREPRSAAVAAAEMSFYAMCENSEAFCRAAERFLSMVPQNPEAMFGYARASAECARASVGFIQFQKYIDRWPDHDMVQAAKRMMEVCEIESRTRVAAANDAGFLSLAFDEGGLEIYATHEESLGHLTAGNFAKAVELNRKIIEVEPGFLSARNNLVICLYHLGDIEEAIDVARENCNSFPDNRFAKVNLIKYEFLTGNPDVANELADKMVADPPSDQDAFSALLEALTFLGRDEDIDVLSKFIEEYCIDKDKIAVALHHHAVASYRMGETETATELWNRCVDLMPGYGEAEKNLEDIEFEEGHAAWGEPLSKWVPRRMLADLVEQHENGGRNRRSGGLASSNKVLATLVPAMLDRGDPDCRELALNFSSLDGTPPMIEALKDFAFGTRGPDSMRHRAVSLLKEKSWIEGDSHRMYLRGQWRDIRIIGQEVDSEPIPVESWKQELMDQAHLAAADGDFDDAEFFYDQILDRDPVCASATYNRATLWQQRNLPGDYERAVAEIRDLHEAQPEYTFAKLTLALIESKAENFDRATELIEEVMALPKLHSSEAKSLYATQLQVALAKDDLDGAEQFWCMLEQLFGQDDSTVRQLRSTLDQHQSRLF